MQVSSDNMTA